MKHVELKERVMHAYLAMGMASRFLGSVEKTDCPEVVKFREGVTEFLHWSKDLVEKHHERPSLNLVD